MFVDASAIVAIIAGEPDASGLAARLAAAERVRSSGMAVYEATLGIARILNVSVGNAESLVDDLLTEAQAAIIPITAEIGRGAIAAFDRFGRNRHPARLNMGDCFAYACARALDLPLLFKGDDFAQTDIAAA
ncbi:MAG TPA: type II toxin-antitoxin system VapC family toxin [Stellaceae bacterium]|jgi:ribonuclease VapC|nr:type II toxin-antitoxin system VapC family toxin [Stellaceae bacterium]